MRELAFSSFTQGRKSTELRIAGKKYALKTDPHQSQRQTYLLLKLITMATLILHLHADFFQLLLCSPHDLVGCCSLPLVKKRFVFASSVICIDQVKLRCLSYLASCSSCSSSCTIFASRAVMKALNLLFTEPSSSLSLARRSLFWRSNCWRAFSLFCAALRSTLSSVVSVST